MTSIPKCCGKIMKIKVETPKFIEVTCEKCNDVVYVKKNSIVKPQLVDD